MSRRNAAESTIRLRAGDRIGIGVRARELRVALVRAGQVIDSAIHPFDGSHPSPEDYRHAMLAVWPGGARARRLRSPSLHLAVGPAHSQLRRIEGAPTLRDADAMTALVQENVSSFFLKNGIPLRVGRPGPPSERGAWIAAFDAPVIDAAIDAAGTLGVHRITAVPISVALTPSTDGDLAVQWDDGRVGVRTRFIDASIEEVTRQIGIDGPSERDDIRLDDAMGAVSHRESSLRWTTAGGSRGWFRVARTSAAAVIVLASAVVLVGGPVARDLGIARRNEARIVALRPVIMALNAQEARLRERTVFLEKLEHFSRRRVRALEVLAALTNALPDSTAIVAFRLDSLTALVTLFGRDAMGAVAQLQNDATFAVVEVSGPVTREVNGAVEMERVAIKLVPAVRPASGAGRGGSVSTSVRRSPRAAE